MGIKQNQFLAKSKEIICMVFMAIFVLVFILYQRETISNRTFNNLDAVALANKFLIIALITASAVFALYFFVIKKDSFVIENALLLLYNIFVNI